MRLYAPLEESEALPDVRLERRLRRMIDQFTDQPNAPIPQATEHRNDMDAAYAFFDNPRVRPDRILHSCLPEAVARIRPGTRLLVLQDSSEANFSSLAGTRGLGYTAGSGVLGLLFHSSIAVTPDGEPLGLLTQQIWTRDPGQKGKTGTRRKRAAGDEESYRWADHAEAARAATPADVPVVHVADREGDIYSWLAAPRPGRAHLLIRVAQAHRVVVHGPDDTPGKLAAVVRARTPLGHHDLELPRADGKPSRTARVTVRAVAVHVRPPTNARGRSRLRPVAVWVVEAVEESPPAGEKGVCWRLVSTEPVATLDEAIRSLKDYSLRWRIETDQADYP